LVGEVSGDQTFHRYRLVRRIARGGMAEVYLAVLRGPAGFEKRVALKKILPVYAGMEEFAQLFKDEARLTGSLDHSAVVQVHEFGTYEGEFYIAMEYVDGPDLEELLDRCRRRGILPPVDVVAYIGYELGRALEYAHSRRDDSGQPLNVIHRDVSPPNVLIGINGEVKLTDFGVAKTSVREALTRPGVLRGKYAYMSPEQVRHRPMDHRSDIFSLGIVLYEALTGVNPFEGSTDYQTMESVEKAEVEPAGFLRPDTPAELDRILLACLEPDAELRYQDARELRRDLAAVVRSLGAPDGPERIGAFLRDVFPERAPSSGERPEPNAENPALPWEALAHRLPAMLVRVPRPMDLKARSSALVPTPEPDPEQEPVKEQEPMVEAAPEAAPEPIATPDPELVPPPPEPEPEPEGDSESGPEELVGPTFREVGPRARRPVAAVMEWMDEGSDPDRILTEPGVDLPFLPNAHSDPGRQIRPIVQLGPTDVPEARGLPDPVVLKPLLSPADLLPPEEDVADLAHTDGGVPIYNEWDLPPEPGQPVQEGQRTAPSAVRVPRRPIVLGAEDAIPELAPVEPPPEAPAAPQPQNIAPPLEPTAPPPRATLPPRPRVPSRPAAPVPEPPPQPIKLAPEDRFDDESIEMEAADEPSTGTDPSVRRPSSFKQVAPSALWLLAAVFVPLFLLGSMSWLDGLQTQAPAPPASLGQPGDPDPQQPIRRLAPLPRTRPGSAPDSDGT
jgi:hypothetical protein